jgi:uncharacterized protein
MIAARPARDWLYFVLMQFTREDAGEAHAILACGPGELRLRDRVCRESVIVTRGAVIEGWRHARAEDLTIGDFASIVELRPEVVLLGTGERQRMPPPALYAGLAGRGIGLEVMDNRAACRTYNLLLSENRDVAVALML